MKFRVVFSEFDIKVVELRAVPETVDGLITELCGNGSDAGDFVLQYHDKDFDSFVNLTETVTLENLMTLKVLKKPHADTSADTAEAPAACASNLRGATWPKEGYTTLPEFEADVDEALKAAHSIFVEKNERTFLKKQLKTRILDKLASQIFKFTPYPSQQQLMEVAKTLVKIHPGIGDTVSASGCELWVNSLVYKMGSYRNTMRGYGCKELILNSNRKSPHRHSNALPPAKSIKKARRGEANFQPDFPEGEDNASLEAYRNKMVAEMQKAKPDVPGLTKLMSLTYAKRRMDINENAPPVSTLMETWPALFRHSEVHTVHIYRFHGRLFRQ